MDAGVWLVLPGILGGICLAAFLVGLNRRPSRPRLASRSPLEPVSPDMINMAHIRVGGIGGLGMVAACAVIAVYMPEIRYALSIGVGLGAALAAILIVVRSTSRQARPGGGGPHANAILRLDDIPAPAPDGIEIRRPRRQRAIATA